MLIAIDGPAGAGKSTVARAVAEALGFTYLDSGAMYRCIALAELRGAADPLACAIDFDDEGRIVLDGEDVSGQIRTPQVSERASEVASRPEVRAKLVELQRDERDSTREHSPLTAAPDAVEVDTTGLTIDEVVARIVDLAEPVLD